MQAGKNAVKFFFEHPHPPDAIFAVEDFTALGAIKELKEKHIRIPKEVGIIGFANEYFGEHITPSLSTVDQQTVLMGKESVKLLLELIEGKNKNELEEDKVILEPIPIFRQSSIKKRS
jgi:LacI family transcriptional regulator